MKGEDSSLKTDEKQAFLERYLYLDQKIDRLCDIQTTWRACAVRIPGMAVQALRHYRATEMEINRKIDELLTIKQELLDVIRTTPGQQSQELLKRRYMCRETWEEIAEHLHLSLQETVRLHKKVLDGIRVPEKQEQARMRQSKEQKFASGGEEDIRREHRTVSSGDCRSECPSRGVQRGRRIHYAAAPNTQ